MKSCAKPTLIEDERIISKDQEVDETLNNYFVTVTDSLGLTENTVSSRVWGPTILQVSLIRFLYIEYLVGN